MLNQKPEGSRGSLIGSIIVVLILIIGAIYLYASRGPAPVVPEEGTATTTEQTNAQQADDVDSLEADAQSMDLNSLEVDLSALEQTVTQ